MSDGIRDAEGRRPDWLSLSSGMGESKVINGLRADLERAECKIDSLTKRLIDADQDVARLRADLAAATESHQRTNATLARIEDELAAERERSAALAAALEAARVQAHHTATTFTVWRRNGYFDAEAAEVWVHNDKEAIVRVANDPAAILAARDARFTESWRKEVDAMRDERDSMAAALALAGQHMTGPHGAGCACKCPVIDGHASGCKIVDAMVSGGGLAALAALKADQRRKGAAWAANHIARGDEFRFGELVDPDTVLQWKRRLERGEVEVPNAD